MAKRRHLLCHASRFTVVSPEAKRIAGFQPAFNVEFYMSFGSPADPAVKSEMDFVQVGVGLPYLLNELRSRPLPIVSRGGRKSLNSANSAFLLRLRRFMPAPPLTHHPSTVLRITTHPGKRGPPLDGLRAFSPPWSHAAREQPRHRLFQRMGSIIRMMHAFPLGEHVHLVPKMEKKWITNLIRGRKNP